jgi:hypothetical protein
MRTPSFSNQGKFDRIAYERYLDYINVKPSVFEETQREYMLKQKIERIIEEGVDVTEDELKAAYAARNPKAKAGDLEKNRESFEEAGGRRCLRAGAIQEGKGHHEPGGDRSVLTEPKGISRRARRGRRVKTVSLGFNPGFSLRSLRLCETTLLCMEFVSSV